MRELRIFQIVLSKRFRPSLTYMGKKQSRKGEHLFFFFICIIITSILMCGCSHFSEGFQAKSTFEEANNSFSQGNYKASLNKYEQIIEKYPTTGDRVLFEMGIIYAHPKNEQKDYQKSLECFQKLIKDYPGSGYRQDSERMIFYINNVTIKDKMITTQQTQIETLQQEVESRGNEIITLQKKIKALEQKVFAFAIQKGLVDKILIEKKERRLMLISKGEVLKTYKIALGGNPNGPKERQGDNKTPEGTYFIDSRNKDSHYHLSLHISYPNERDKKRAKELGVSTGGNIMIHGIKNGFSWVGDFHTEVDWTKGCIAVTDEEIEEIAKLAPNGTIVEIRP
ncbi:L,D-transpeptidase family protein [Geotalea uraniireducens]|uniref:ErfK/YbiS/YcfS/YnhG family protein n=1 Tax=Geotalea uraniireducens (strain Rf4) TaxID=351605 RepID=A5G3H8_GEOUR|nr:L,D-transpeptidase family protein [Geotalea uraniireducens]ABQ26346.1 ErfK/YbiS/YcfS/YnhG family protein [Geotalea uraniireducens Rf4]